MQHYVSVAAVAGSGIRMRLDKMTPGTEGSKWTDTSFFISTKNGSLAKLAYFDELLIERLVWIQ
jgi:hypothetical protein